MERSIYNKNISFKGFERIYVPRNLNTSENFSKLMSYFQDKGVDFKAFHHHNDANPFIHYNLPILVNVFSKVHKLSQEWFVRQLGNRTNVFKKNEETFWDFIYGEKDLAKFDKFLCRREVWSNFISLLKGGVVIDERTPSEIKPLISYIEVHKNSGKAYEKFFYKQRSKFLDIRDIIGNQK